MILIHINNARIDLHVSKLMTFRMFPIALIWSFIATLFIGWILRGVRSKVQCFVNGNDERSMTTFVCSLHLRLMSVYKI